MPFQLTEARLAANRLNAARSTGPRTAGGKARSRMNALKHGLTGAGIALPVEDEAAVEARFLAIQEELAPQTVLGVFFAHQMALMTVRCQRAARQEAKAVASKIRRAPAEWDEARAAEADHLMGWIGAEPVAYRRKLMATPEGVDRLIDALMGLRSELDQPSVVWDFVHGQKLAAFFGTRESDIPLTRGRRLSDAIQGNFTHIDPSEVEHLTTDEAKRNWACDQMDGHIRAEVERLEAHRASLDLAGLRLDRAEAGERALFDAGKEATLARKYEAAATRELYRALREFRAVEATGALDDPDLFGPSEPPSEAAAASLPEAIEAGDAVDLAAVGRNKEERKPTPNNDLERSLASFGTDRSAPAHGTGRGPRVIPAGPDQPLDRAQKARRRRLG